MPVDFMKINIKVVSFLTHFRCSSRQRPGGDVACFCSLRNFRCLECGSLLHVAGGILSFVFFIGNIHTPPHQPFLHIWLLTLRVPLPPPQTLLTKNDKVPPVPHPLEEGLAGGAASLRSARKGWPSSLGWGTGGT